jgi:hypothetical protein
MIGSYIGKMSGLRYVKYYESMYNSQQTKIYKYKQFLLDQKLEDEYESFENYSENNN